MFLVDWLYGVLHSWGLWEKKAKIVFLGLDNAGKTTLLHTLYTGRTKAHLPTRNPTSEEFVMGTLTFQAFDLGGHAEARRLWKDYFIEVDAIVYIIDAAEPDRNRRFDTKCAFNDVCLGTEMTPILVLGNKIDKEGALSEEEFRQEYDLFTTTGKENEYLKEGERPIEVFMCSIVNKDGYGTGFQWLGQHV